MYILAAAPGRIGLQLFVRLRRRIVPALQVPFFALRRRILPLVGRCRQRWWWRVQVLSCLAWFALLLPWRHHHRRLGRHHVALAVMARSALRLVCARFAARRQWRRRCGLWQHLLPLQFLQLALLSLQLFLLSLLLFQLLTL